MAGNGFFTKHDFYCINCGKLTYPINRKQSHQKGKFHRKKLYCPWCRHTVNSIEVRNDEEAAEFKLMFERGDFKEEAEESIRISENSNLWEEFLHH